MSESPYYIDQTVRVTDLNYGDHLGITQLSGMAHNARLCFLKSLGLSELDIGGPRIMATESKLSIKKECFHGDVLRFFVKLQPHSKVQFKFIITVYIAEELVAEIEDLFICYDYERKRPVAIPEGFRRLI